MEGKYIITPDGNFAAANELQHHGIPNMRWGRRRYQNEDGSLTAAGRERYGVGDGREKRGGEGSNSNETDPRKSRSNATDDGRSERVNKKAAVKAKKKQEKIEKHESKLEKQEKNEKQENQTAKNTDTNANDAIRELRTKLDGKSIDEISDKNLKARLERMANEDKYDKAMNERGYIQVEKYSDMDRKISELKKQKEYTDLLVGLGGQSELSELTMQKNLKTLQQDIANLDKEIAKKTPEISDLERKKTMLMLEKDIKNLESELHPKKVNPIKTIGGKLVNDAVVPAVTSAGKNVLQKYLEKKGMKLLGDDEADAVAGKVGDKIGDKAKKFKEKADKFKEKSEEKSDKSEADTRSTATGEILKNTPKDDSSSSSSSESGKTYYYDYDDDTVFSKQTVSGYLSSPSTSTALSAGQKTVAGYLSASASSKSSTIALGESKVAGLLNAPASSSKKASLSITRNAAGVTTRIKGLKATGNYTNAEIADKLGISESTLNRYLYGGDN